MEFKQVTDKAAAKFLFTQAYLTDDGNASNYSPEQFEESWNKWLGFFTLSDGDKIVAFCGVRDFGDYARIFDRYFVVPDTRQDGLGNNQYVLDIINPILEYVGGKIPFFSIEGEDRRNTMEKTIEVINDCLDEDKQFHLLDGMHETVPGSWQNIAIQKPHDTFKI